MTSISLSATTLDVTDELLANARVARKRVEKPEIRLDEITSYLESTVYLKNFGNLNDIFVTAAYNSWQAHSKIAIAVDPDMVHEIIDMQASEIPGEMFTRLPYVNPLIVFPEKIEAISSNNQLVHILGFFAYGRRDFIRDGEPSSEICNTDDPNMNRIGFLFVSYVPETQNIDFTRVSARLKERVSVEDAITEGVASYGFDHTVVGVTRNGVKSWFGTLLSLSLNTTLYLVSSGADVQRMPLAASNKPSSYPGARYARPRKTQIVKLGWRLGPRLRHLRHEYEQSKRDKSYTAETGTVIPHPVRAHFRTYWTGSKKSKQIPILRFITPFWTGLDSLDDAPKVLIRK